MVRAGLAGAHPPRRAQRHPLRAQPAGHPTGGAAHLGHPVAASSAPPIDTVRIGFVGVGLQGGSHVENFLKIPGCRITAVCDLDARRLDDAKVLVNDHYTRAIGKAYAGVTGYADYRALLANPDIDAVVVGLDPTAPSVRALETSKLRPGFDITDPMSTVHLMPPLVDRNNSSV